MYIRDAATAEQNAAARMRDLGFTDARTTPPGADNGIDVVSRSALAQVKWRGAQVPRSDIQRLFGARGTRTHLALLFFSASGYSKAAVECANELGVMLFEYDPDGSITPRGHSAHHHVQALEAQRRRHEQAERERLRQMREARDREARHQAARAQSKSAPPPWLSPGDQLMWQHRQAQASPHWSPPPQDLSKRRPPSTGPTVRSVGCGLTLLAVIGGSIGAMFLIVGVGGLLKLWGNSEPIVERIATAGVAVVLAMICWIPVVILARRTRQQSRQIRGE